MAKLYFRYGAMGSGKSIDLLKVAYNYEERDGKVVLYTAAIDTRYGTGIITTRIGINKEAIVFSKDTNILDSVKALEYKPDCILIDESQFLTKEQVSQIGDIVDYLNIPVICYGLRTDFRGELFEGSKELLAIADKIEEIKTICKCGKKATYNMRLVDGKPVNKGEKILIGGNESYISLCRKCYKESFKKNNLR